MNDTNLTLALLVGVLFAGGAYLLMSWSLVRVVMGFMLIGHGANLLVLQAGGRAGDPPVSGQTTAEHAADPLPQAMILTAIVITFGVSALLLALAHRHHELHGDDRVPDHPATEEDGP